MEMKYLLALLLIVTLLVAPFTALAAEFTPAAELEIPLGKKPYLLPADVYSEKPLRIAAIGGSLNEFSLLVNEGRQWAIKVLADRNCQVDFHTVPAFNAMSNEEIIRNCISLGYDGIVSSGFSEVLQPVIQEAVDQGIIFCTYNTDAGVGSARHGFFGEDSAAPRQLQQGQHLPMGNQCSGVQI